MTFLTFFLLLLIFLFCLYLIGQPKTGKQAVMVGNYRVATASPSFRIGPLILWVINKYLNIKLQRLVDQLISLYSSSSLSADNLSGIWHSQNGCDERPIVQYSWRATQRERDTVGISYSSDFCTATSSNVCHWKGIFISLSTNIWWTEFWFNRRPQWENGRQMNL